MVVGKRSFRSSGYAPPGPVSHIFLFANRSTYGDERMTISVLGQTNRVDHERLPCRIEDPELWFAESPAGVEYAKALCQDCPARALCLDEAVERREPWGVW